MTNAQIVGNAAFELMKAGIIGTTGRTLTFIDASGTEMTMPEPEQIHTFAVWQSLGFRVKKGQKAIAKLTIWKHTVRTIKTDDGSETSQEHMFPKTSAFFARHQVEPITA